MSARNVSHGTSLSIASSGSPFADKASKRLSASKNPSCPIVASANQNLTHQIRTGRENQLFFEVPFSLSSSQGIGGTWKIPPYVAVSGDAFDECYGAW